MHNRKLGGVHAGIWASIGLALLLGSCKHAPKLPFQLRDLMPVRTSTTDRPGPVDHGALPPHPERVEHRSVPGGTHSRLRDFELHGAGKQEKDVWCWAACAQMVLKATAGVELTQEELAARIHGQDDTGKVRVEAASRYEILCALNPDLAPFDRFEMIWEGLANQVTRNPGILMSSEVTVTGAVLDVAKNELLPDKRIDVEDLRNGYPMVVGLRDPGSTMGHAWVLYGVTYRERSWVATEASAAVESATRALISPAKYQILSVDLVDPYDGSAHVLPFEAFEQRLGFTITASSARQQLLAWRRVIQLERKR